MNKHIIHVIPTLEIGGAETMLLQLLHGLAAPFFTHTIITLQKAGRLGKACQDAGARIVELGMPAGVPNMPGLTDALKRAIDQPPDILQGWRYHGNVIAQTMRSVTPKPHPPVVWSIHSAGPATEGPELAVDQMHKAYAMLSGMADAILYTSTNNLVTHSGREFAKNRATVVPSGIDLEAFKPNREAAYRLRERLKLPPETKLIAMVSPLRMQKDPITFFDALIGAPELDAHFVLVGQKYDKAPNANLPPDLLKRVHFLGIEDDMPSLLAGVDVLTRASRLEAMPRTMLEAMACETLCVCVDSGENATMLKDVGWTVRGGEPLALADGWRKALTCAPGEAQERRRTGRARVEAQFSTLAMSSAFAEVYANLTHAP